MALLTILRKIKKALSEFAQDIGKLHNFSGTGVRQVPPAPPVHIVTTPPQALEHLVASIDKKFGQGWDKTPTPSDSIETIMFRAGAKMYREQLLKEIHVTHPKSLIEESANT